MKASRAILFCLVALLCLVVPCVRAQEATTDAAETARQLASAANDNAFSMEEQQEALRKLEESVPLFLNAGQTVEAARALNRAGRLQLILHTPPAALVSHQLALVLLQQTPDLETEVDGRNGLGAVYVFMGGVEAAEKELQRSLSLSEQGGYELGQAQGLLTLSELQNNSNHSDHAVALQTAQKALKLWQALDDKRGLARAYAQVGRCYMAQNILPESTQSYQQALSLWSELNNPSEQAECLIMLGYIEFRRGEWNRAIEFYAQAQSLIDEKTEVYKMGQIACGMADAYNENGLTEDGLTQYEKGLAYYRQAQDPHAITYATWGLGATHYLSKNYPQAIAYLEQGLEGMGKDSLDAAQRYEYLGMVYISKLEYSRALEYLEPALAIYTRAVNRREESQVRALIGQIYEQQGDLERARLYYRQAAKTFAKLSDPVNEAAVDYALGRLELRAKNYTVAEHNLRQSVEVTEHLRLVPMSSYLTAAFSANIYERYEKYVECLMREHDANPARGFAERAFQVSELSRGRALAELLRDTQTNLLPGLDPKLAEQEKSLRQALKVKKDLKVELLSGAYKKEELDALEAELARLKSEYERVDEIIRARYPSYKQITRPVAWDLQPIQEQVVADDQTVLLEYILGEERSYVWAVTRDRIRSYELPASASINEVAAKVYKLLANPPGADTANELSAATGELARMILSPVSAELNRRRLIVVADGALNYIPFQVLPTPSDNDSATGELLVDNYEVVNAPSASILGELREEATRRQPPTKMLAAFGDPAFKSKDAKRQETIGGQPSSNALALTTNRLRYALRDIELNGDSFDLSAVPPLFYARRELAALREVTAGRETFVAEGSAATREKLLSTDLTQYAILHIATHGLLNPKRPEISGLVLATVNGEGQEQNGFVGLEDIYQLRAPVNLVVLSACRTALGKDVRGEGLVGLTRGFMYAGASSVVASLWEVNDEATAELMKQFYINMLQKGMPPAAALSAAQKSIRQIPEWRSPYFWGAFTLQGDYRQVLKPTPKVNAEASDRRYIALGALLLLSLTGFVGWRQRRRLRLI